MKDEGDVDVHNTVGQCGLPMTSRLLPLLLLQMDDDDMDTS